MKPKKKKKKIKTRDWLLVQLLKGATKAGIQKDKKKEAAKKKCREKVKDDE